MLLGEQRFKKHTKKKTGAVVVERNSRVGIFFHKIAISRKKQNNSNIHNDLDRNLHVVNKIQQLSSVFSFCLWHELRDDFATW